MLGPDVVGYCVCHQIAERCLRFDGLPMFVCSRCCGLYIGFAVAFTMRAIAWRGRARFPTRLGIALLAMLLLAMVVDVLTSAAGWRETTNPTRFTTGLLAGSGLAIFLYPLLRLVAEGPQAPRDRRPATAEWLVPVGASAAIGLGLLWFGGRVAGWIAVILSVAGLVSVWTCLNAVLGIILFRRERRVVGWRGFTVLFTLSLSAVALEFLISSQMHSWVVQRVKALD